MYIHCTYNDDDEDQLKGVKIPKHTYIVFCVGFTSVKLNRMYAFSFLHIYYFIGCDSDCSIWNCTFIVCTNIVCGVNGMPSVSWIMAIHLCIHGILYILQVKLRIHNFIRIVIFFFMHISIEQLFGHGMDSMNVLINK